MSKDEISFKNRDRFIQMGIAISSLRKMRGMSQEQLAEKASISRSHLSAIEAPNMVRAFSMEAFTPFGGRRTRIMGTTGYIEGDGSEFTVYESRSNKKYLWNKKLSDIPEYKGSGHGGGDMALVCDFLESVSWQDPDKLTSTIDASIESHVMGFRAEKSRLSHKKVDVTK